MNDSSSSASSSSSRAVISRSHRARDDDNDDDDEDKAKQSSASSSSNEVAIRERPARRRRLAVALRRKQRMEDILRETLDFGIDWENSPMQLVSEYAFGYMNRWAVEFDMSKHPNMGFFQCQFDEARMILVTAWQSQQTVFEFTCHDLQGRRTSAWPDGLRSTAMMNTEALFAGIHQGAMVFQVFSDQPSLVILSQSAAGVQTNIIPFPWNPFGFALVTVTAQGIWLPYWMNGGYSETDVPQLPLTIPWAEFERGQRTFDISVSRTLQAVLLPWNATFVQLTKVTLGGLSLESVIRETPTGYDSFRPRRSFSLLYSAERDYILPRTSPMVKHGNNTFWLNDGTIIYNRDNRYRGVEVFKASEDSAFVKPLLFMDETRTPSVNHFVGNDATPPPPASLGQEYLDAYELDPDFAAFVPVCGLKEQCAVVVAAIGRYEHSVRMCLFT